jgi:hypothetical protein
MKEYKIVTYPVTEVSSTIDLMEKEIRRLFSLEWELYEYLIVTQHRYKQVMVKH